MWGGGGRVEGVRGDNHWLLCSPPIVCSADDLAF